MCLGGALTPSAAQFSFQELLSPAVLRVVMFVLEGLGPWPIAAGLVRADGVAFGRAHVLSLTAGVAARSVAGFVVGPTLFLPGNSLLMAVIDRFVLLCLFV